jgi:hypothetical protein
VKNFKKKLVVKIDELPLRAENLGYTKIHEIYGGNCKEHGYSCCDSSECCFPYGCVGLAGVCK